MNVQTEIKQLFPGIYQSPSANILSKTTKLDKIESEGLKDFLNVDQIASYFGDNFFGGEVLIDFAGGEQDSSNIREDVFDLFVDYDSLNKLLVSSTLQPNATAGCDPQPSAININSLPSNVIRKRPAKIEQSAQNINGDPIDKKVLKRERNRQAAERCRARRVNLISTLQDQCKQLQEERERLKAENRRLIGILSMAGIPVNSSYF